MHQQAVEVTVIAQDAQGAELAKPWVEQAGGTFKSLLDQKNLIGKLYNLKYVPVGILVDEEGYLARTVSSVDIDDQTFKIELENWVTTGNIPASWQANNTQEATRSLTPEEKIADQYLDQAVLLLTQDQRQAAIEALEKGYEADPTNWLIRKQLWAVQNPSAFYDGPVDYSWQQQRIQEEDKARI